MATTCLIVEHGSDFDATGDEFAVWLVTPCDDDGEPTGPSRSTLSRDDALALADKWAAPHGWEVAE